MKIACCLALMLLGSAAARAASCASLVSCALPDLEITLAKTVGASGYYKSVVDTMGGPAIFDSVTATGRVERTPPFCSYPRAAVWKRSGSTDSASSFVCAAATR
jgi:hypothetical protein